MNHIELLRGFFTTQQPLGPISADDYEDSPHKDVFRALYDTDNLPFRSLGRNPTMIVGRKGAGKTDVLLSYKYETSTLSGSGYDPVVYFTGTEAAKFINAIMNQVSDAVDKSFPSPMVEDIADLWTGLFWICILSKIAFDNGTAISNEKKVIATFVAQYGISEHVAQNPYATIHQSMLSLRKCYEFSEQRSLGFDFFTALHGLRLGDVMLEDARLAALNWLRNERKHAIILFDSVEALDLRDPMKLLVVSGLLKAIGGFEKPGIPVAFRCCIPSESYYLLTDISSNVLKDFQRMTRLQWSSIELLRLAAKRYSAFLELYCDDGRRYVDRFDFSKRAEVVRFWEGMLPQWVPNTRSDQFEPTLSYMLRHTQLLPRQFLLILNEICSTAIEMNGNSKKIPEITEKIIVEKIRFCEQKIVAQILQSYSTIWPDANDILESVLPMVGENIISYSDLHSIYNRRGIQGRMGMDDFNSFLRMLSQLGVAGRLVRSSGSYASALFEYSEPSKLIYRPGDVVCFHPVFTEHYRVIIPEALPDSYRPVYPLGTDPDSEDRRVDQASL